MWRTPNNVITSSLSFAGKKIQWHNRFHLNTDTLLSLISFICTLSITPLEIVLMLPIQQPHTSLFYQCKSRRSSFYQCRSHTHPHSINAGIKYEITSNVLTSNVTTWQKTFSVIIQQSNGHMTITRCKIFRLSWAGYLNRWWNDGSMLTQFVDSLEKIKGNEERVRIQWWKMQSWNSDYRRAVAVGLVFQ